MVGPVTQALQRTDAASADEVAADGIVASEDVAGLSHSDAVQPVPVQDYRTLHLPTYAEHGNDSDRNSNLGEEFDIGDIDDDFALPPPAMALEDELFEGAHVSMFRSPDDGPASAFDEDRGGDTIQLSAAAMAAHLQSLQLPSDSVSGTRCPSPELATLATEATEETDYQFETLELPPPTCCAQRHRSASGAFLPCGAAVRVGRRRVAARPPRQMGLAARRTAAPGCGLPLRGSASHGRHQHRGAAH
mmetsp:Transcript_109225/g.319723  ORF Transcript_109225/g.319723 Transcript_109225/m.319723 type:complete len:247 (-) Transcript_109225:56-796(-)